MGSLHLIRSTPTCRVSQKRLQALLELKEKIAELISLEQRIENQIQVEIRSGVPVETGKISARVVNERLTIY